MRSSLGILVASLVIVAGGCGSAPVPSATVLPSPPTAIAFATPSPASTASPTIAPTESAPIGAALEVTGDGSLDCGMANYGGCVAALVLQPYEAGPLPTDLEWPPPMEFEINRTSPGDADIVGSVTGVPARLAAGRWRVGLAQVISSDAGTCDDPCTSPYFPTFTYLLCQSEFEVAAAVEHVAIRAHFSPNCTIEIDLVPHRSASGLVAQGGLDATDVVAQRA